MINAPSFSMRTTVPADSNEPGKPNAPIGSPCLDVNPAVPGQMAVAISKSIHTMRAMRMRHLTSILCLFVAGSLASLCAADWPQWRGPHRDGKSPETGLLTSWPEGGPKQLWKAEGLGGGYSTVSVSGGKIFTSGDQKELSYVVALNEADGKPLWTAKLGKPGAPGWGGFAGPRATPTIDGNLLFTVDQWGELVCLDTEGKEVWRKNYTVDFKGPRPEWGFSESPLVDGNQVVITPGGPDGTVVALEKKTGKVLWQTKDLTDPAHYSSIIKATVQGVEQYIQLTAETLFGISPADGKILWSAKRKGRTAVIPDPVYSDGFVYVTSGYGVGCNLFKLEKSGDTFTAAQVYANGVVENHHGGVVLVDGFIYGHSDKKGWTCQNLKTGEAKWTNTSVGKGSVMFANGYLILRQEDKKGTVALVKATPEGFQISGRFDQPDRSPKNSWAHPVVANGKLYLRDQDILLCYDISGK
jgi:outer membrane protein assembly factor BamB